MGTINLFSTGMPALSAAGLLLALSGCASAPDEPAQGLTASDIEPPRAFQAPPEWRSAGRPVTEPLMFPSMGETREPEMLYRRTLRAAPEEEAGVATVNRGGGVGPMFDVRIATNRASATEVLRTIAETYLEQSFVFDPAVVNANQQLTLNVDERMTRADVRDLFAGIARLYGWMVEQRDDVLYVRPAGGGGGQGGVAMGNTPAAPIIAAQAAFESELPAVSVQRLRFITAGDAVNAIERLQSPGAATVNIGRTVLIIDTTRQINRLAGLLEAIDVPAFEGVEMQTFRLAHRRPTAAAEILERMLTSARLTTGAEPLAAFIPVPGTPDLMVISRDSSVDPVVRDLIRIVDTPQADRRMGAYVYRIQHYEQPTQLVQSLQQFFGDRIAPPGTPGAQPPVPGQMRLTLDQQEDVLLIRATPDDYAELLGLLAQLDRPRQQVLLNSIIAEVVLNDRLEFGVDYFLNALDEDGTVLDLFATPGLVASPTGTISLLATDGLAIIQALQSESDVEIISQPRVVIRENFTAEFQVGGETPIINTQRDSATQTGGTTGIEQDVQYRDTGITLTITPRINEGGEVTLEIEQEVNEVGGQTEFGPEFTTRSITTQVTVPHGRTLLLGGIIETETRDNVRKVPLVGDIPLVGLAFQNIEKVQERRELFLAITPRIINDPMNGQGTLGEFFEAARGVRAAISLNHTDYQQGVLNSEANEREIGRAHV
jgi:general secretion pathway protein D